MKVLKLIGLPNLLLLAVAMFVFKYGFLDRQAGFVPALDHLQYAALVFACVFIAAGGFFINNVFGFGKDEHPTISEAKGYNIYAALTLIGVGLGYYIAGHIGKPFFTGLFIIAAALLYIYATSLKATIVISNVIIALVVTLPIVAIGVFNLYPIITDDNYRLVKLLFELLLDYSIFTFTISLILTFINDLANNDADYNAGLSTLPIAMGRARSKKIVIGLTVIPIVMLLYYGQTYIVELLYVLGYGLLFILGPLIYFLIKLWDAKTEKEFKHLETVLTLVLFFTALSIVVITFNINYNAKG
jgi:4-hydroxybenzoate polyprenyltransferase